MKPLSLSSTQDPEQLEPLVLGRRSLERRVRVLSVCLKKMRLDVAIAEMVKPFVIAPAAISFPCSPGEIALFLCSAASSIDTYPGRVQTTASGCMTYMEFENASDEDGDECGCFALSEVEGRLVSDGYNSWGDLLGLQFKESALGKRAYDL
jgi:hypothetical protein